MFFYPSKIVWILLAPTNFLIILGLVGTFFLFTGMRRTAKTLVSVSLVGLFLAAFSPVGEWVLGPLENRFPQITELDQSSLDQSSLDQSSFDGIIVLGGATNLRITRLRSEPTLGDAAERIFKLIELARLFPEKTIAFTGGGGFGQDSAGPAVREADVIKTLLERTGLPTGKIIFERESLNTWQNAENLRTLLEPGPESRWLLVTSAFHMPRAVGVFRQAGYSVIAYPVDFRLGSFAASFTAGATGASKMAMLDQAVREWIGLTVYWLTGRSAAFFPGP